MCLLSISSTNWLGMGIILFGLLWYDFSWFGMVVYTYQHKSQASQFSLGVGAGWGNQNYNLISQAELKLGLSLAIKESYQSQS